MSRAQKICILHLITTLEVGGAEMMLHKLLSKMDHTRFKSFVICLSEMGLVGQKIAEQGIRAYSLNMPRGRLTIKGLNKLQKLLNFFRPKVMQTWMYHADLLGYFFGRLTGIKHICWNIRCSNMNLAKYPLTTRLTIKLCALMSKHPDAIVSNSHEGIKYHKSLGYRNRRWEMIPNGFDLMKFKPDAQAKLKLLKELGLGAEMPATLIGYIARFDPMKDHPTFLDAACGLLRERRDVHFVMVGRNVDWSNRIFTAKIPKIFLRNFHLLGERSDVERITAGFDVACSVSSYGEGFSNAIGEAMACGVPCVVTDVGDSAVIVADTGKVIPPKSPGSLAKALYDVVHMPFENRREMGLRGRERIGRLFSLERIVDRYENLYMNLVSGEICFSYSN
jgi:glycosyltransferase involved in cell wall biosynthesis